MVVTYVISVVEGSQCQERRRKTIDYGKRQHIYILNKEILVYDLVCFVNFCYKIASHSFFTKHDVLS